MRSRTFRWIAIGGAVAAIALASYELGYRDHDAGSRLSFLPSALAQAGTPPAITPTGTLADPNIYFPGTEALAP